MSTPPNERKPRIASSDASIPLTEEEGFVLSRVDGSLTVEEIGALTGLPEARVGEIVERLRDRGAVAMDDDAAGSGQRTTHASRGAGQVEHLGEALAFIRDSELGLQVSVPLIAVEKTLEMPAIDEDPFGGLEPIDEHAGEGVPQSADTVRDLVASSDATGELDAVISDDMSDAQLDADSTDEGAPIELDESREPMDGEPHEAREAERNYRKLYESKFHPMTPDQRLHAAAIASGPELLALTFDPDPKIVKAILSNTHAGLDHARYIAVNHKTAAGLDILAARVEFLRDALVERRLLRNIQLPEAILKRILMPKRLTAIYKTAIDREVPELTRSRGRLVMRTKFVSKSEPEERADLVIRTEGRCLIMLPGCTFDARTTLILIGRQYNSVLFIQNLARFPACPPTLLAHLYKQPMVRRQQQLKKLLLQHKNMPTEVKRQG